jgi:hypothetical protein
MKSVNAGNARVAYSHVAHMFYAGSFPHCSKPFRATFLPHRTPHLQPLDVTVMWLLTAKYAVTQNEWMMASPGGGTLFLISSIIASAHPVEFIMKNVLDGFENSGIWPF